MTDKSVMERGILKLRTDYLVPMKIGERAFAERCGMTRFRLKQLIAGTIKPVDDDYLRINGAMLHYAEVAQIAMTRRTNKELAKKAASHAKIEQTILFEPSEIDGVLNQTGTAVLTNAA